MKRTLAILMGTIVAGAMSASAQLVAGWDTFSGTGSGAPVSAPVTATNVTASFVSTTEQLAWNVIDERGASADGDWGTFAGPPVASTIVNTDNQNLELSNATTGGTLTFTITNNGLDDIELGAFHFDSYAFRPKAARSYELSVLAGSGITPGVVYTSSNDEITHVAGAWDNLAHDDIDHDLTGLADHTLAAGESVDFLLAFSSGVGDGAGGHDLWVDNVAVSQVIDSAPIILEEPQDTEVVLGAAEAVFSVGAVGSEPLAYQWFFGASELVGETSATLTLLNPGAAELGDYSVTVANALGSTSSASATLSYISGPITPGSRTAVEGGFVIYGVELPQAAANYTYQWNIDGGAIPGETGAELVLSPIELADAGNYTVDVTFDGVTETSDPVELLVAPAAANDYPTTVLANNPIAWWRLGELAGTNALDGAGAAGGPYDMVYEPAVELDNAGAILGDPDRAARFDGTATSKVNRDYTGALNPSGSFSVEAWALVEGSAGSQRNVVISWDDSVNDEKWGYQLKATAANRWRFTTGGFAPAINNIDGPEVVPFEWTHLVGVYNGGPGTIELYVNGFASGAIPVTSFNAIDPGFPVPILIGEDFDGLIDEVAFYGSALSQAQVLEHYAAGLPSDAPPEFSLEPGDELRDSGGEVTFTVVVRSIGQPSFQWQKDGSDIPGATASSLTLTNLTLMDEGGYRVLAEVAGNVVTSAVGNLTVRQVDLVLNPDDDGELRNNGTVLGTQVQANLKNAGDTNPFTRKAIYRFDLSSFVSGTADANSFIEFKVTSTTGYNYTSSTNEITLWGLNDGSSGESWDPLTITYLTAPGNDTNSASGMLEGAGDNQVANLGSFSWGPGVAVGDAFTVSGAALAAFLNADTDNQVTFYLSRTGGDPGELSQNFLLGTVENANAARRPVLGIVTVSTLAPLGISLQGGLPEITWTDTGTLQQTEDLDGTWTDVPAATSPYTPAGGADVEHFRLRE